jgi:hypothetical protein
MDSSKSNDIFQPIHDESAGAGLFEQKWGYSSVALNFSVLTTYYSM